MVHMISFALLLMPVPPAAPSLSGPTNFGTMTITGTRVEITGNPAWTATGTYSKGVIKLVWIHQGRTANAVYIVGRDGTIAGVWGWSDQCQFDPCDGIEGEVSVEVLRGP